MQMETHTNINIFKIVVKDIKTQEMNVIRNL